MADRISYSVSVTPIETIAGEETSVTNDIIASEIGKSFSGNGTATVTDYSGATTVQGYASRVQYYLEAIDSADTTEISSEATASFVYIKNTGYTFSSTTVLGGALDKSLKVMSGTTLLSVLSAGEAIVFKDNNAGIVCTGIHVRTVDNDGGDNASAGHLAVEYLVVD